MSTEAYAFADEFEVSTVVRGSVSDTYNFIHEDRREQ
jgi:hypothetical protein